MMAGLADEGSSAHSRDAMEVVFSFKERVYFTPAMLSHYSLGLFLGKGYVFCV